MTIYRVHHDKANPCTVINNSITKDSRISWKAKGIWLYAFSRPDDRQFYHSDLVNQSTDGKDSVTSGLQELEDAGYLYRERERSKGRYTGCLWIFCETPKTVDEIRGMLPHLDGLLAEVTQ